MHEHFGVGGKNNITVGVISFHSNSIYHDTVLLEIQIKMGYKIKNIKIYIKYIYMYLVCVCIYTYMHTLYSLGIQNEPIIHVVANNC